MDLADLVHNGGIDEKFHGRLLTGGEKGSGSVGGPPSRGADDMG